MACIEKYKAPNGEFSSLHDKLTDALGIWQGERAYLLTNDEEFQAWFGRKVDDVFGQKNTSESGLDENWEPMLFWHGTYTKGINQFNRSQNFFTTSKEAAMDYAKEAVETYGGQPVVYPVFIRIRKNDPTVKVRQDMVIVTAEGASNIKSVENDGSFSESDNIFASETIGPEEIHTRLNNISAQMKSPGQDERFYSFQGRTLQRVSSWVDEIPEAKYRGEPAGQQYAQEGTRYHKIIELLINGRDKTNAGLNEQLREQGMPPIDDKIEGAFVQRMRNWIARFPPSSRLMAEVKVADTAKGIAGTIDILHIKENGHVDIYDIKTAHETPWKRRSLEEQKSLGISNKIWDVKDFNWYKAERYSLQTQFYGAILEAGDTVTGAPPLVVDNIFVIPIEIQRDVNDAVYEVNPLSAENIKSWQNGSKSFYGWAKRKVSAKLKGTPMDESLTGRDVAGRDIGEALKDALGVSISTVDSLERRAIDFVETYGKFEGFNYGHGAFTRWVSDDRSAKIEQIKAVIAQYDANHAANMSSGIEHFFQGEYKNPGMVSSGANFTLHSKSKDPSKGVTPTYARTARLTKILNYSNAKEVVSLATVKGFEQYNDIMLVKRGDGGYDLLTFTNIPLGETFTVKNNQKSFSRKIRTDGDSIIGNHLSPYEAEARGILLKNNYGDFTKLRLASVALELQSINPSMRVNRIIVDNMMDTALISPRASTLDELTPQIRTMASIENVKNLLPTSFVKNLQSVPKQHNVSEAELLNELNDYLMNELSEPWADKLSKQIDRFSKNEVTKDELANELLNGSKGMRHWLRTKNILKNNAEARETLASDKYFMALAQAWLALKGLSFDPEADVADEFVGQLSYWIKSPTNTGRKMLDKFFDLFRKHVDNIKREVQSFLDAKDPVFHDLVNEDPFVKRGLSIGDSNVLGTDAFLAMGRTVMEPLIQTRLDTNGNKYQIPMLWAEGSPEYEALTVHQKRAIKFFNDWVEKMAPGKYRRGQIPIIRTSSATKWYRAKRNLAKGELREALTNTNQATGIFVEMAANKGNFQTLRSDNSRQYSDVAYDQFAEQTDADRNFSTRALEQIGLDSQMNLVNPELNQDFETDIERVLTLFVSHYIRKAEMDKALPIYHIFRSAFKYQELAHGLELPKTIEMIDEYVADIAFNMKIAEDAKLSKVLNVAMRLSSLSLLALNPNVFIGNTLQMTLSSLTDAFGNTITNALFGKDGRFPDLKDWGKAAAIMTAALKDPAEMMKIYLMRQKYMPEDLVVLTGEKYQKTARGMINEQLAYLLDRSMELGWRTHHLIAQMVKDDVYDAHTVEREVDADGHTKWVLKYDKNKDPRFKGEDGQLFYNALRKSMDEKGELDVTGEISGAYDWKLRERIKAYINRGIGSFDRDLASPWARHSLMTTISQFRNWFVNRFQRITKLPYQAEIFGDYRKVDGEIVWASEEMKGILWTLTEFHRVIPRIARGEYVSRADKENLAYMASSLSAVTVLFLLSVALIEDDDDDDFIRLKAIANNNIADLMSFVTGGPFATILTSPAVFASYFARVFDTLGQIIVHGAEGDTKEVWNNFNDIAPVINQIPHIDIE